MGRKQRLRQLEARVAALEAATPIELPPAVDIELAAHQPILDYDPPRLDWPIDDDEDWRRGSRWGFGSYL